MLFPQEDPCKDWVQRGLSKDLEQNLNCLNKRVIALLSLGKDSRPFVIQDRGWSVGWSRREVRCSRSNINSAALYKILPTRMRYRRLYIELALGISVYSIFSVYIVFLKLDRSFD